MGDLEDNLKTEYIAVGVSEDKQHDVNRLLDILESKDINTYNHSLKTGILSSKIGKFMHLETKALLYAGLLHDIGKALINLETLTKTERYDEKDYEEMKKHAEFSYHLLKDIHPFTADIVVRVHYYQENGYPEKLPDYQFKYSKATQATIDFYAMIVSLADFYDSARTRISKFGDEKKLLTKTEVKNLMLKKLPHFKKLIGELYTTKIFEDETAISPEM